MHYTVNQWKLTALSEYSKYKNIFLLSQSFSKKSRVEKHLLKRRRRTAPSSLNTRAKLNSLRNIWGIYLVIVLREGGGRGKPMIFIGCSHLLYAVWPINVNRVWVILGSLSGNFGNFQYSGNTNTGWFFKVIKVYLSNFNKTVLFTAVGKKKGVCFPRRPISDKTAGEAHCLPSCASTRTSLQVRGITRHFFTSLRQSRTLA